MPTASSVKQTEQLLAAGGKFYALAGESWCDTPLSSWKLVPAKGGYVLMDGPGDDVRENLGRGGLA